MANVQVLDEKQSPRPLAWRIDDAARQIGVSRVTVYKLVGEKKLSIVKIGGRSVILDAEIVRFLEISSRGEAA